MDGDGFLSNVHVWSALAGWVIAQSIKMFTSLLRDHKLDFRYLVSTGGMPSAHSSLVSALTASVGITAGFETPLFAATLTFAAIVMFDAQSVRRAAGAQASILNQIIDELFKEHHLSETKLKELLGHTRIEVFFGMLTGVLSALLIHSL